MEISERTQKAMNRILNDFENKIGNIDEISMDDEKSSAAVISVLAEFGLNEDEFVAIVISMVKFFIVNTIPMTEGIQLAMLVGMIFGREMDSELRHEAGL